MNSNRRFFFRLAAIIAMLTSLAVTGVRAANVPITPPPPPCNNPDPDNPDECKSEEEDPKQCDLTTSKARLRSAKYELGLGAADYLANRILRKSGFMFHIEHATLKAASVYQRPAIADITKNQPAGETRGEGAHLRQVITRSRITDITALPSGQSSGYTLALYRADTRPAVSGGYYNTAALSAGALLKRVTIRNTHNDHASPHR